MRSPPRHAREHAAGPATGRRVQAGQRPCDCQRRPAPTPPRLRTALRFACRPALASLARSPAEGKCCRIQSSLPRTVVLPSANNHRPPQSTVRVSTSHQGYPRPPSRRQCGIAPLPTKPIPFLAEALGASNRHLGAPERVPGAAHATSVLADQDGAPLDLLCLSSSSPLNLGLPFSAIPGTGEPASEEMKPRRMPRTDWQPSASAAPTTSRSPPSTRRTELARHSPHPPMLPFFALRTSAERTRPSGPRELAVLRDVAGSAHAVGVAVKRPGVSGNALPPV